MTTEFADELQGVDVTITRDLIERGQAGDCWCCPAALGLNSVLDSGYQASVSGVGLFIERCDEGSHVTVYNAPLPEDAEEFVADFDEEEDAEPCTLHFELPRRFLKTSLQSLSSGV